MGWMVVLGTASRQGEGERIMGIKEIPLCYVHKCDGCMLEITKKDKYRPPHWAELKVLQDAYDGYNCAVADDSTHHLLCDKCTEKVVAAINAAFKGLTKR
jgi:hypothetical protein